MFKHKKLILLSILVLSGSILTLTGCESDEDNQIAQAQECFDRITDSAADDSKATTCFNYISNLDSAEANALKCAIKFREGGLKQSTIVTAYQNYDAATGNQKEAALIDALGISPASTASTAFSYCNKSGVAGLVYLGGIILLASNIDAIGGGVNPGAAMTNCKSDPTNCATAEVGQALVAAESLYCVGSAAEEQICQDLANAISTGGSDYSAIAQQFLQNVSY